MLHKRAQRNKNIRAYFSLLVPAGFESYELVPACQKKACSLSPPRKKNMNSQLRYFLLRPADDYAQVASHNLVITFTTTDLQCLWLGWQAKNSLSSQAVRHCFAIGITLTRRLELHSFAIMWKWYSLLVHFGPLGFLRLLDLDSFKKDSGRVILLSFTWPLDWIFDRTCSPWQSILLQLQTRWSAIAAVFSWCLQYQSNIWSGSSPPCFFYSFVTPPARWGPDCP